jgi:DHHC palmitoyltransferase
MLSYGRLNTCIGEKNYTAFLVTSFSAGALTSFLLAVLVALVVDCFTREDELRERLSRQSVILLPYDGVKGILLGTATVLLGIVVMVYQLIGFHCMLVYKGITTYDFYASSD